MADFWNDLRHSCRGLQRSPAFAAVAIGMLAIGLGANTAVFILVHNVLIADLPVQDPERLVVLSRANLQQSGMTAFPYLLFRSLESDRDVLDGLLCRGGSERVTLGTDAGGEPANGELVSGNYFEVLGVKPHVGRLLTRADDVTPGAHPVVVVSHRYWMRRFAGDPAIVGRTLWVSGYPMTVAGVSPPGFDGLDPGQTVDLRIPLSMQAEVRRAPSTLGQRGVWELNIVGRLKRGVSVDQAQQVLSAKLRRYLDEDEPASRRSTELRASERMDLRPAANGFGMTRRQFERSLRILTVITASVLVVVCLNLANLLLTRAFSRAHEFAVRRAVGAGSGRLARQLLTESLVIAVCGGALGALLAYPGSALLMTLMAGPGSTLTPDTTPRPAVLLFHVLVTVVSAGLFGFTPSLAACRPSLTQGLKTAVRTTGGMKGRRFMVAGQVALSVIVLVGAVIFVRAVHALRSVDLGFRADRLLVLSLSPKNAGRSDEQVLPFFRAVRERVGALPGVTAVTYSVLRPVSNASWRAATFVYALRPAEDAPQISRDVVGPDYFATLGIPLIAGRDFTAADDSTAQKVAIVNQAFVRAYFWDRDPLGAKLGTTRPEFTVIGVAKDSKYAHVRETTPPVWYIPYEQQPNVKYLNLYVRTAGDPESLVRGVRSAIASIDQSVALFEVRSQEAQIEQLILPERTVAAVTSFLGAIASALAAVGLYGVLAFVVTQRRREIGIRMARGARRMTVFKMVFGDAALSVGLGITVGAAAAVALYRYAASVLNGMVGVDGLSIASGALLMALVSALATFLPAHRAARIDPADVLRDV